VKYSLVNPSLSNICQDSSENILLTYDTLYKWKAEGVTDDVTGKLKN
jgi:hypothetical protein